MPFVRNTKDCPLILRSSASVPSNDLPLRGLLRSGNARVPRAFGILAALVCSSEGRDCDRGVPSPRGGRNGNSGPFCRGDARGCRGRYQMAHDRITEGMYLTPDPMLQVSPGWEEPVYAYVRNNPILYADPLGLLCVKPAWKRVNYYRTYKHVVDEVPLQNVMQFHLTCTECCDVRNIHLEYGYLTSKFDSSGSAGGDAPARIFETTGGGNDVWVKAEVRSTLQFFVVWPDVKACYDCERNIH